nr:hypothetical protein CFP56_44362 [Quercus suber]
MIFGAEQFSNRSNRCIPNFENRCVFSDRYGIYVLSPPYSAFHDRRCTELLAAFPATGHRIAILDFEGRHVSCQYSRVWISRLLSRSKYGVAFGCSHVDSPSDVEDVRNAVAGLESGDLLR